MTTALAIVAFLLLILVIILLSEVSYRGAQIKTLGESLDRQAERMRELRGENLELSHRILTITEQLWRERRRG